MIVEKVGKSGLIKAWIYDLPVEEAAWKQLREVASLPFIHKHVAVMPDVHVGMGATIGSVIPTKGAVVPAAVGVDIGCGMCAVQIPDPRLSLEEISTRIQETVPHGRSDNGGQDDVGAWRKTPIEIEEVWHSKFKNTYEWAIGKYPDIKTKYGPTTYRHLGTLGTGNHFIEVSRGIKTGEWWIVIHSGSRGVGNRLGAYFVKRAQEECEKWFVDLPNKDLAYFPQGTGLFEDYLFMVDWAQQFAQMNRQIMLDYVLTALEVPQSLLVVDCHHNFVAKENHFGQNILVTRKGAVRARKGDLGIIPGSMGAKTYIVRGKGNPDSFTSCSHGAGRVMSRGEARKSITVDDHIKATKGVVCKKGADILDESPAAYKNIDRVMVAQKDLVDVVTTIKQVVCVKG